MWEQDHVVHCEQRAHRMTRVPQGLAAGHVERGTCNHLLLQRHDQRGFIDDRAARRIDQERGRLHERQFEPADEVARGVVQHRVDRNDVARLQQRR
jgi:hypothetical protein